MVKNRVRVYLELAPGVTRRGRYQTNGGLPSLWWFDVVYLVLMDSRKMGRLRFIIPRKHSHIGANFVSRISYHLDKG